MKKLKNIFSSDNLPIIIVIIIIIIAISIFAGRYINMNKTQKEISETIITIDEALEKAYEIFEDLGEKDLNTKDFEILKTRRDNVEYYYITSKQNTVEIEIKGGRINRINNDFIEN